MSGFVGWSIVLLHTVCVHNIIWPICLLHHDAVIPGKTTSSGDAIKEKAEDPPTSGQSKFIPRQRQRQDYLPLDLFPRLFEHMKRGVWGFHVLPEPKRGHI
jgi:hypothetical protein